MILIPAARIALKGKRFTKARVLARMLDITPSLGGQILSKMPEWSKHINKSSRSLWIWEAKKKMREFECPICSELLFICERCNGIFAVADGYADNEGHAVLCSSCHKIVRDLSD